MTCINSELLAWLIPALVAVGWFFGYIYAQRETRKEQEVPETKGTLHLPKYWIEVAVMGDDSLRYEVWHTSMIGCGPIASKWHTYKTMQEAEDAKKFLEQTDIASAVIKRYRVIQ